MNGTSPKSPPLGFPRGEAVERSETDEGRRQVKRGMHFDERYQPKVTTIQALLKGELPPQRLRGFGFSERKASPQGAVRCSRADSEGKPVKPGLQVSTNSPRLSKIRFCVPQNPSATLARGPPPLSGEVFPFNVAFIKLSVHAAPHQSRPCGARQLPPGGSQGGAV